MSRSYSLLFALSALLAPAALSNAAAGAAPARSPLDPTAWGVVAQAPAENEITLHANVPYLADADGKLTLDIYLPADLAAGDHRPAVVFMNAIGDMPDNKLTDWEIYRSWPRLVTAHGLAGVSMEADGARIQDCLRAVFTFLAKHGAEHGIDGTRIGVYAASANVNAAGQYLLGENAAPGIRCAVLYYGNPPEGRLRGDLPVLFVVAESDVAGMKAAVTDLWPRVIDASAPWTLLFASDLPHAFDAFSEREEARRVVAQTLGFWKTHLDPPLPLAGPPSAARAIHAAVRA